MTAPINDLTEQLKAKSAIGSRDILALRRIAWSDGVIDPAEAEAIFDLNGVVKSASRDWVDFFVEAMSVFIVQQQQPTGYVDDAKAAWLMARIDRDGRVESLGELELLVKIMETATNVPDALKTYALAQIERVVLSGSGPTRDGGAIDPGRITASEVKLLRRLLFAQASDAPGAISRAEADMLFRIKDATLDADNAPDWQILFVQAVGAHLMAHSDYRPLARDDAARLDAFMNDDQPNVGGFFGRMAKAGLATGFRGLFGAPAAVIDHAAAVAGDRAIAPGEAAWLKTAIDGDGQFDPIERALVAFVLAESGTALDI